MLEIARRLDSAQCFPEPRGESWPWGDLRSLDQWKVEAPAGLSGAKKTVWAKERRVEAIAEKLAPIDVRLKPGVRLGAEFVKGEMQLLADGVVLLDGIYLSDLEGAFILPQWRRVCRTLTVTEALTGKKVVSQLLGLRGTENEALRGQVVEMENEVSGVEEVISGKEVEMERVVAGVYGVEGVVDV